MRNLPRLCFYEKRLIDIRLLKAPGTIMRMKAFYSIIVDVLRVLEGLWFYD